MSSGQQRGRGGRGGDGRGQRRGDSGGSRGGSPSRGGDRGGFRGGDARGSRGRGATGPPRAGQNVQMTARGGRPQGDIYLGPAPAPDPTITAAEDELVIETRGRTFEGFTGRRGYGTLGTPINLRSNYLKVNTAFDSNDKTIVDKTWYRYVLDTGRTQLSKEKKRRLLEKIVTHPKFSNVSWATDYANFIVTTQKLDLGDKNEWMDTARLPPLGGSAQSSQPGPKPQHVQDAEARNSIRFKVTYSDSFTLQHIMNYLQAPAAGATYQGSVDVLQMMNVMICKPPQEHTNVANVGQNKFYPVSSHPGVESMDLRGGLLALRGYYASVRPTINRLLLNLNVTSGAFYKPIALIQLMSESGLRRHEEQEQFIEKLKVRAEYTRDNESQPHMTRIKTIVGFAKQPNPPTFAVKRFGNAHEVKFSYIDQNVTDAQPQDITVYEYFRKVRGITLKRPELPVLNVATRNDPQYLPPELCIVLPGQPFRKFLAGQQTSEMIKFAARFPNLNAMSIAGTQQDPGTALRLFRLGDPQMDPQLLSVKPFGFGVDLQMVVVPGRILDAPRVNYASKNINPERGSWNCANQKFATPGRFGKWQVMVINRAGLNALEENPAEGKAPEALFAELERQLKQYGLTMGQRVTTQRISLNALDKGNRNSNDKMIEAAFQKAQEQRVNMLFIVLPEQHKWLYARIKFHGDCKYGIHTINAIGSKLQSPKGQLGFMGNLALKFNIKGGGVSHKVPNILARPLDSNTMLMGIDVTHPSPGSAQEAPSIASIVASVDEHLFQWPGSIRPQTGRVEMVQDLTDMVLERLDLWRKKHNGGLPSKIVIYRDGVSEGQYEQVLQQEIPPFQKAFTARYGQEKNWPKLAVIIVGKRHQTRFYPTLREHADSRTWNPLPGTVVDRGIVGRILREFWLQAHQGLQGTARPAHYVVLKDDIAFEADELEQFTHKMCYTFNRATKAVSICPPAYYADLLCERGRSYLFSTLAEDHGSDSSVAGTGEPEWTGGVHRNLSESTWYI